MKNATCAALFSTTLLTGCAIDLNHKLPEPNYTNEQTITADAEDLAIRLAESEAHQFTEYFREFDYDKESKILTEVYRFKKSSYFWTLHRSEANKGTLEQACGEGYRRIIDGGIAFRTVFLGMGGLATDVFDAATCSQYDSSKNNS